MKTFWKSKTFWFNALTAAAAAAGALPQNEYTLIAVTAINLGLRVFTTQALTASSAKAE
jgi:predicted nucleic acid-binding protein